MSMFEIIIADLTSMRSRVILFYLPALPYLVSSHSIHLMTHCLHGRSDVA